MTAEAAAAPDTGAAVRQAAAALAGTAAADTLILAFVVADSLPAAAIGAAADTGVAVREAAAALAGAAAADSLPAVAIGGGGGVRSAVRTELRPAATPAVPVVFEPGIDMT